MNALFVHSHRFRCINGQLYSSGGLPDTVLQRYIKIFGDLTIVARVYQEQGVHQQYSKIDSDVTVIDYRSLHIGDLKNTIASADYIVIRTSLIAFPTIYFARKLKKPYIVELVGDPWGIWNHSFRGKLLAPFLWAATKKCVRDAPYVVYVTEKFLQKRYPTKGKSVGISNVALMPFDNGILETRQHKIKNTQADKPIIIGTAAAVNIRLKGQQYVIVALGRLKKEGITKYRYQLIGGGDQTYLRNMAKKHNVSELVEFLGSIPHEKVFEWFDSIDLYVQPSRAEGLPRALVEAMSRGLPAFGASSGGIPELLEDKFVFSNTKRNINEICDVLDRFDENTMLMQAERNFNEAKKYEREVLEQRRNQFFRSFIGSFSETI